MVPRATIVLFTVLLLLSVVDSQEEKGADSQKGKSQKGKGKKGDSGSNELLLAVQNSVAGFAAITELIGQQTKEINGIRISFNDAKAEMEKFQSSMEDKIKELDTKLSQQVEVLIANSTQERKELSTKFFQQLSVLNDKLTDSHNITTTKHDSTSARIENLSSELNESRQESEELRKALAISESTTTLLIADVAVNVTSDIEDLTSKVSDVEGVAGTWPSGSYCIFQSGGSCPSGFTSYYGHAQYLYSHYPNYYNSQVTFGDSSLGCMGGTCDSGDGIYDTYIIISSCCK